MQRATVIGRATSTVKHASLEGRKLIVCEMQDTQGNATSDPVLALDAIGANQGDTVILSSDGLGLRQMLGHSNSPARWWTLGIVDA